MKPFYYLPFAIVIGFAGAPATAQPADARTTATASGDAASTDSEWLSDKEWQSLSREERRARSRRATIARYEPSGVPSADRLDSYIERFASSNVYDTRYYLYKVKATLTPGTTGTITLTGDVYPAYYKNGLADLLGGLGFTVAQDDIRALPVEANKYGIATTNSATLRKEPRREAEQLSSVAYGGSVRFLRPAEASDITSERYRGRRSPNADRLPADDYSQWALAQSMEGYIGFVRKSDFRETSDYSLPDGILTAPVTIGDAVFPAGVFANFAIDGGWHLATGEKLPASAKITDMRPDVTADSIKALMQPFMETGYVWGGTTDEGIDCSGFSQFFLRSRGAFIPRDAVQQATSGLIVAWGIDQVCEKSKPGDIVFFASDSGRIGHVAISLGGSMIIHSAGEGVHIADLKDRSDKARENNGGGVAFARRILPR